MSEVALKILEYPDQCRLDQINRYGNTALIIACRNKMSKVALEILEYPNKFKLYQINKNKNTALIWSIKNNMEMIALEILKCQIKLNKKEFNKYWYKIYELSNEKKMEKISKIIEENYLKDELDGKYECVFCCKKTDCCIIYSECKHSFITCKLCKLKLKNNKLQSNCPLCRKQSIIKDTYLCTSLF